MTPSKMSNSSVTAFIALGSNLGDRQSYLASAIQHLGVLQDIQVTGQSTVLETEPLLGLPQPRYLNQVIRIETTLAPEDLLTVLLTIEEILGRVREAALPYGSRTLDLDLLFYGTAVMDSPSLSLPHPRLHEREFILAGLVELDPHWHHPVLGQSVQTLLNQRSGKELLKITPLAVPIS